MKKIIILLLLITASAFQVKAQSDITIPVNRISYVANDTGSNASLFNYDPYTVELKVISGSTVGNFNFYYKITDSIAANTFHVTPFGLPYTRTSTIEGNIQFPITVFNACFNFATNPPTPNITYFNELLSAMDMEVDTTRQFIIR